MSLLNAQSGAEEAHAATFSVRDDRLVASDYDGFPDVTLTRGDDRGANETLVRSGDCARADEFFAPGYVAHVTGRDLARGPDAVRRFVRTLHDAFSELAVTVEVLAETHDRVAWLRTCAGMQRGRSMGFPATDRRIVWSDMVVSRFRDALIEGEWVVTDLAERLVLARKA